MKTVQCFAFIFFIMILSFNCGKKEEQNVTKQEKTDQTPESSGNKVTSESNFSGEDFHIKYKTEGIIDGTMDIIKSGNKFKQKMDVDVKGIKSKTDVFVLENEVYTVTDLAGMKTGFKTDLAEYNKKKQIGENFSDFRDLKNYLKDKKKTGEEEIIGYKCDVIETDQGISLSVYDNKYVLKIKGPQFTATATALEKNPKVSSDEFEIPKDVDFSKKDPGAMSKEKIKDLINKYKK